MYLGEIGNNGYVKFWEGNKMHYGLCVHSFYFCFLFNQYASYTWYQRDLFKPVYSSQMLSANDVDWVLPFSSDV